MSLPRDFKGIWIPKELWLDHRLSIFEKCVIAEIDSLDCGEDHCYASNDYLAELFNVKVAKLRDAVYRLKELGFLSQISFNGRTRVLKSHLKTIYVLFQHAACENESSKHNFSMQPVVPATVSLLGDSIEPENKVENKVKDISKDISKKRIKKNPEPTKEREPGIFTTDYEHQKLIEKIGSEKDVKDLYFEMSRWKKREGIERGDDYKTAIKWHKPKQQKVPLAKKDRPKIHDDPILGWKFVKKLEETDALAAKHELNKMDQEQRDRYERWKDGKLYGAG